MNAAIARNPFDPPHPGGLGRALALALAAHLLLALALTWSLRWNSQPQNLAVQAELWSPAVQQAAPRPAPPDPPPPPVVQTPPAPPAAVQQPDPDIALAQKRAAEQRQLAQARERQRQQQALAEKQAAEQKAAAAKKAAEEAQRKEQLAKAEAAKKAEADKRADDARRTDALRRMTALASADNAGQDERNAGPSGDYAAQLRGLVRQATHFPADTPGNPTVVIEVHTGPTGDIISLRVIQPSGVKAWDDAVLRALDRIQKLPSDHGRYWNPMEIRVSRNE